MTVVYMVQNDTNPPLEATLTWKDRTAVDLTGSTVKFYLKKGETVLVDRAADVLLPPTNGKVQYNWVVGDTNVVGVCRAEFEVTFPTGKITSFPADGFLLIVFREELK